MEYKKGAVHDYLGVGGGEGGRRKRVLLWRAGYRWALIFFIGFLCAVFGVSIHMLTIYLVTFKNNIVTGYMYSVGAVLIVRFVLFAYVWLCTVRCVDVL